MKLSVRAFLMAGLVLIGVTCVLAQKPAPREYPDFFFQEFQPMPPLPPMPPVPEIPPIPPMPPLPPMPQTRLFPEDFSFAFGEAEFALEQVRAASAVDPQLSLQQEVFRSIIRHSPERAVVIATERLKADPGDPVVLANMSALASISSNTTMPLLVSIAKTSTNVSARRSAISAIARRSDANTLATLEEIYNGSSDNVEVRRAVVQSISRVTDPRAVAVLARVARTDADLSLRRAAVQYLGRRSEAEANKMLEELLRDPGRG